MSSNQNNSASESLLRTYFKLSDTDNSGSISDRELQKCLGTGDQFKPFDLFTVQLLMSLFIKNTSNTNNNNNREQGPLEINYEEFKQLWQYIAQWQDVFVHYDQERRNALSVKQVTALLQSSGFSLSAGVINLIVTRIKNNNSFASSRTSSISSLINNGPGDQDIAGEVLLDFDDFIHMCIIVQKVSKIFHKYDPQKTGTAHMSYDAFVWSIFELVENFTSVARRSINSNNNCSGSNDNSATGQNSGGGTSLSMPPNHRKSNSVQDY
ncbi:hypothetical protein MIR68_005435 [Amoeboaphelidium protococcarum]|nr:hypothetical protein MIR68_005435 [Amoeboaphelidium protococcarum]